jgi:hypothetical protein
VAFSNCWSDVLRTYWANLQLFVDLRTGLYADLSSNSRVVSATNAARPIQSETRVSGKALDFAGVTGTNNGYLSVPTAAALDLRPSGTIVILVRSEKGCGGNGRLAVKRNVGVSCAYDVYDAGTALSPTGTLTAYDGATSHNLGNFIWPNARSLTVSFTSGSIPWGYMNGYPLTAPATLWASTADASSVYLPGASGSVVSGVAWWGWLLFDVRLTGAEIAQLHTDFVKSGHVL